MRLFCLGGERKFLGQSVRFPPPVSLPIAVSLLESGEQRYIKAINASICPKPVPISPYGLCGRKAVLNICPRAQELCENRDGRPGFSVLTSLMVSVDVKQY